MFNGIYLIPMHCPSDFQWASSGHEQHQWTRTTHLQRLLHAREYVIHIEGQKIKKNNIKSSIHVICLRLSWLTNLSLTYREQNKNLIGHRCCCLFFWRAGTAKHTRGVLVSWNTSGTKNDELIIQFENKWKNILRGTFSQNPPRNKENLWQKLPLFWDKVIPIGIFSHNFWTLT